MSEMPGLSNDEENENVPASETPSEETPETPTTDEAAPEENTDTPSEPTPAEAEAEQPAPTSEAEAEATPEPTESTSDAPAEESEDDDDDGVGSTGETRQRSGYERGEIIDVVVKEVSPTQVIVELDERGEGFTGVIPNRELERMGKEMLDMLQVGETVKLYVVNTGDPKGNVVLSLNRALEKLDWQRAEQFRKDREIYEGVISGYNKGGLIVRFGRLRGFIPQSQISDERRARLSGEDPDAEWGDMVKEEILVKVIEVDRDRNRLILSERAAARETREARKAALIQELTINEVRTGRVVSLEDFGAFVDIGGAEGLVHLTELSWGHVTHPKQVLSIGEEITVEVINIDEKRKRIGLSLKRQLADPWDVVASDYREGQLVRATVTKLTKFGAFAQLEDHPEIEGLIHISELSEDRVEHPRDVVQVNEALTLRIVKMDVADRRLGLSLKAVSSTEYMDDDMDLLDY
ncbi:MAG: S1 RNA-binding domain-containing protein [Chloroflexota bacterium]